MSQKGKSRSSALSQPEKIDVPVLCKQIIQQYSHDTAKIQTLEEETRILRAELKKAHQIIERQKDDLRAMHNLVALQAKSAQEALKSAERSLEGSSHHA
mmetsp:Transcript_8831/g.32629  ORF Transcript_8831/g.32629 Transcript_8831/m.32629 type:complete len:99 (+) Transcript_8831:85-381(+)